MIPDERIEDGIEYLRGNASAAAKAHADRQYLEKSLKPLVATIMAEHSGLPVNAQEREAWRDPRVATHLEALRTATEEDEKHKWQLEAVKAELSAWQTMHKVELAMKI